MQYSAKVHALGCEGTNIAWWVRSVKTQCNSEVTIRSLMEEHGHSIEGQVEMCEDFYEHFAVLIRRGRILGHGNTLQDFLARSPHVLM